MAWTNGAKIGAVIFSVMIAITMCNKEQQKERDQEQLQLEQEKIAAMTPLEQKKYRFEQRSKYPNASCKESLREKMRDPKSYEPSPGGVWSLSKDGNKMTFTWQYRANNGFGGKNVGIGDCYWTWNDKKKDFN